jgi:FkbM family methyltransferase
MTMVPMPTEDVPPRFAHCLCTTYRYGRVVFPLADTFLYDALVLTGDYCLGEQIVQERLFRPGGVALDVGANIGLMTLQLARLAGPDGRVVAFEPSPFACGLLLENLRMNALTNVEVRRAVVSSGSGESRFLDPDLERIVRMDFGRLSLAEDGSTRPGRMVPTPRTALDDLGLRRCDFIKVDVEGHEAEVIRGAMGTIDRCRPALSVEAWNVQDDLSWVEPLTGLGYRAFVVAARVIPWPNLKQYDVSGLSDAVTVQVFCLPDSTDIARILDKVRHVEVSDSTALAARLAKFRTTP